MITSAKKFHVFIPQHVNIKQKDRQYRLITKEPHKSKKVKKIYEKFLKNWIVQNEKNNKKYKDYEDLLEKIKNYYQRLHKNS